MWDDYQGMEYSDFQTVTTTFTQGLRDLPTDYATRVKNFLAEYLGNIQRPVPFGGRAKEFSHLNSWLADPQASPYVLLAAPAGRGKSALLLRWCLQLFARHDVAVAYFPVSIRFRTNLAGAVFPSLVALLAHLHKEKVPTDPNLHEEVWRGLFIEYLTRPLPAGRTLVLVMDGVDEAADWSPGPDLFPVNPPSGLRVVLSARYLANDPGPEAWLQRLNWTGPGLAQTLDLYPLDRGGIASVLQQMGFPLDMLSTRVNIVSELYRLSEGDPLLVRLYINDLWQRGQAVVRLQPEELRSIQPGLTGYFERWWQDQRLLWSEDAPQREAIAQMVLSLLAAALGPLSQADILSLLAPGTDITAENLAQHFAPLARFVTGDGIHQGYVFSHPRLGNYFLEERLNEHERQEIEQRFLAWGAETLAALNAERMLPEQASSYCIQYYGAHLECAGASAAALLPLVSRGWMRAWEKLDRASAGFLSDVERAWRALEREDQVAATTTLAVPYLGEEVRCLLCQASVNSVTSNISPRLMLEAVKTGVWTPAQGLACIRLIGDLVPRARELTGLAPYVQEPLRTDILQEALDTVLTIKDVFVRFDTLVELASTFSEELLWQVLELLPGIEDEADRAGILTELANALAPYPALTERALAYVQELEEEEYRALALEGLISALNAEQVARVWQLIVALEDERYRAQGLMALVPVLPAQVIPEAWQVALVIRDGLSCVRSLTELVPYLPEAQREEGLQRALDLVEFSEDREFRVEVLVKLAPLLTEEQLLQTIHEIQLFWDEGYRASALLTLLPNIPEALLPKFLEAVLTIKHDEQFTRTLLPLLPLLPVELLKQVLERIEKTWDEGCRVELLARFMLCAPDASLPQLLTVVSKVKDPGYRVWLLAELEVPLAGKLDAEKLKIDSVFAQMPGREARLKTLLAIIPRLSDEALAKILDFMLPEIFDFSWRVQSDVYYAAVLTKLGPRLPEAWWIRALEAIRGLRDELLQAQSLIALAPRIHGPWLSRALDIVKGMKNRERRSQVLETLVSSLPEERKRERVREMLQILQVIKDETERVQLLSAFVASLPAVLPLASTNLILQGVGALSNDNNRARVLELLAPHLPQEAFEEVLAIVQELHVHSTEDQAHLLVALAPHLPAALFSNVLLLVQALENQYWRTYALTEVTLHAPTEVIEALTVEVESIRQQWRPAEIQAVLIPYISQAELPLVWSRLLALPDDTLRTRVIAQLADRLSNDSFPQLWEMVQAVPNITWRTWLLKVLAPRLSQPLFSQLLQTVLLVKDNEERTQLTLALLPSLPESAFAQFWKNLPLFSESEQVRLLEALAPRVPSFLFSEFFVTVSAVSSTWTRVQILEALFPRVPEDHFLHVWGLVETVEQNNLRVSLQEKLLPYIPARYALHVWGRIYSRSNGMIPVSLLKLLLPHLAQKKAETLARIVQSFPKGPVGIELLEILAPYLTGEQASVILDALLPDHKGQAFSLVLLDKALPEDIQLLYPLATLAPYLAEEQGSGIVAMVLERLEGLNEMERARLLAFLAPAVPPELRPEFLRMAWALTLPQQQVQVWDAFLAALLPGEWGTVLAWIVTETRRTGDSKAALRVLNIAYTYLAPFFSALLYPLVHEILHLLALDTRRNVLATLSTMAPALFAVGGEATVLEICSANLEVGTWWP